MRVSGLLCATAVVACFNPVYSSADTAAQRRAAASAPTDEQTEPFHKHHDSRHGHDHYYPDRGAIVRDLPVGTIGTSYAGVSYRYHDGIWLEPRGPAYMVVAPPVGLVAPTLPLYSTVVTHGTESFLYCNDTYYRPRPDLGGYEVVNDPAMESAPPPAPDALVGGQMPGAGPAAAVGAAGAAAGFAAGGGSAAGAAMPIVAREVGFTGGTMPGVGAGAAAVPATSLGANAGTSAAAAPAVFGGAAAGGATTGTGGAVPVVLATGTGGGTGSISSNGPGVGAGGTPKVPKVFLYPKNGQSADQQARDRYDCYRFAVAQSGFDPMRTGANAPAPGGEQQSDFERAQSACFEGRGYSNR